MPPRHRGPARAEGEVNAITDQELKDYSADHLYYELWMLYETATLLVHSLGGAEVNFVIRNAVLESFAVHARSLAGFLYHESKRDDDVTAEDYVENLEAWRVARGQMPNELDVTVFRTGKEVAHLTTKRYPPGSSQKVWSLKDIFRAFIQPLKLFVTHALPGRLDVSVIAFIGSLPSPRQAAEG